MEPLARALELIEPLAGGSARVMVGITGPPGAGKSTLAEQLAAELEGAIVVPMDGFHLANAELERLGLANCKGAPPTFDALGFVHLLRRLRAADELVYAPFYSRGVHESIGGWIPVPPEVRTIVVEGNYLLVRDEPWDRVKPLLDLVLYLDAPPEERVAGLLDRQRSFGLDELAARDWVLRSDEANAALVAATRAWADAVITRR